MAAKAKRKARKKRPSKSGDLRVADLLKVHFGRFDADRLSIAERQFPFRVRADVQHAVDRVLADNVVRFCGVRQPYSHEGLEFTGLLVDSERYPPLVVPPQYEEVDVGEEQPVRCLRIGLWLMEQDDARYAVLMSPAMKFAEPTAIRFQIATTHDARGAQITDAFFKAIERAVNEAHSYRGKILSLEQGQHYSGQSTGIQVHRLRNVEREQVILPARTLDLLDRNVIQFVRRRAELARFGQPTKKGLLFYGPPGTGKSHTIHYLAGALEGHTVLLITAEQVGLLSQYMTLARLLQPSVVVIEDVDLIARNRESMDDPCAEVLLNKLLNEMDGLRESADILFLLTTNRPQALEAALASRPGRIDQAIEFPLPDEAGRAKLVRLYAAGVEMADEVVRAVVARTEGVSGAFIKELMRRSVQFHLERDDERRIDLPDVESALEEMLFSGGSLNVTLLGGRLGMPSVGADGNGSARVTTP